MVPPSHRWTALALLAAVLAIPVPAPAADVPVGGAVAYFGELDALPAGWVPCDGRTVADPASPLNGKALPDLRDRFLRGAGTADAVGAVAGDDAVRLGPAGGHDHGGVAASAGAQAAGQTGTAGLHHHTGQTAPAGGGISTSGPLPGTPGGFSQQSSAHQHGFDSGIAGAHSHGLPAAAAHGHAIAAAPDHNHQGDNRPRHVTAWFICRVK